MFSTTFERNAVRSARPPQQTPRARGIDEIPVVHSGGLPNGEERYRQMRKAIRTEISKRQTALISGNPGRRLGSSKNGLLTCSQRGKPLPEQAPQSPTLQIADEAFERSARKEPNIRSVSTQQHTADELETIAAAVNYLPEHGILILMSLTQPFPLSAIKPIQSRNENRRGTHEEGCK